MENELNITTYVLQVVNKNDGKVLVLPQALRDILPDKIRVSLSIIKKHSMHLFTEAEWETFQSKLRELPRHDTQARRLMDFYLGSVYEEDISDGFLYIPQIHLMYLDIDDSVREVYVSWLPEETKHRYSDYLLYVQ